MTPFSHRSGIIEDPSRNDRPQHSGWGWMGDVIEAFFELLSWLFKR